MTKTGPEKASPYSQQHLSPQTGQYDVKRCRISNYYGINWL